MDSGYVKMHVMSIWWVGLVKIKKKIIKHKKTKQSHSNEPQKYVKPKFTDTRFFL